MVDSERDEQERVSLPKRAWLAVAVAAFGIGAFAVAWNRQQQHRAPREELPISSAQALDAGSPTAEQQPDGQANATVSDPKDQPPCDEVVREITAQVSDPHRELSKDEQNELFTLSLRGVAMAPWREPNCPKRLRVVFEREMTCGITTQKVAEGLFAGDLWDPEWTADLLEKAEKIKPACVEPLIVGTQVAHTTNLRLSRVLEKFAKKHPSGDVRMMAWLGLGSHEDLARKAGLKTVEASIDAVLARELTVATERHRIDLLEAAGNAVCTGCRLKILEASRDADAYVRRAGMGALRGFADEDAVKLMCQGVAHDREGKVREHVAWALRWTSTHPKVRATCLADAARDDTEPPVRMSATFSLTYLSEDSEDAFAEVLSLRDDAPDDVEQAVREHLQASSGARSSPKVLGVVRGTPEGK